ncbi:MAG: hypothetical protein WCO28_05690 [Bacteroidota bacterium]
MKKSSTGLLAGAIMLCVGMIVGQVFQFIFPSIKNEYLNQNLFRLWSDPLMSSCLLEPFLVGIILAYLWEWTKGIIKGESSIAKGLNFGLTYWIISIPGMWMSYGSFPISLILTISWSATILVQAICSGILFSKMLK